MIQRIFRKNMRRMHYLLQDLKLKIILLSMMIFIGLIFFAIQFYTIGEYSEFVHEKNSEYKANIVQALVEERLQVHHYSNVMAMVNSFIHEAEFRSAFKKPDAKVMKEALTKILENTEIRISTIGIVNMVAFNQYYEPLASWDMDNKRPDYFKELISNQKTQPIEERLKIVSRYATDEMGVPLHVLIVPIGALKNHGYLMFVTSPMHSLEGLEKLIQADVGYRSISGKLLDQKLPSKRDRYSAENNGSQENSQIIVPIYFDEGQLLFNMEISFDNRAFITEESVLNSLPIVLAFLGLLTAWIIISYTVHVGVLKRVKAISRVMSSIVRGNVNVKIPPAKNDFLGEITLQLEKVVAYQIDKNHLTNELIVAKRSAEIANMAKSEFLANMSHELRTPLNAIIGFSEIMTSNILQVNQKDKFQEYAGDIHRSGIHLLTIINDILDLSKVEAGSMELCEEDVNIYSLVDEELKLINIHAQKKNISLSREMPENLPILRADERILKQILINLLSNAVKFTPDYGKVLLKVALENSGELVLSIIDNGVGIEESKLEDVQKPFQQVDGSFSREFEGTGLGLALVKAFMELHDGFMTLESEWGLGTTVSVVFPEFRTVKQKLQKKGLQALPLKQRA